MRKWTRTEIDGKIYCAHRVKKITIIKMITLIWAIYRFSVTLIKVPMAFFTNLEQIIVHLVFVNIMTSC